MITEQELEDWIDERETQMSINNHVGYVRTEDVRLLIRKIREREWISIDTALPEPRVACLTFTSTGLIAIRKRNTHKFHEVFGNRVTHWMPISIPRQLSATAQESGK